MYAEKPSPAGRRSLPAKITFLTFRELEALSSSRLTILLALLHARIASQKSRLLQQRTQLHAELTKRAGKSMLCGAGLTPHPASAYRNDDIEFGRIVGSHQRLLHQHAVGFIEKVCFEGFVVNSKCARSGSEEDASGRCFPAACSVVLN